jgi:hypothetical protein
MDTFPLIIVILSALMHASYNYLVKTSTNKTIFIWSMYSFALVIVLIVSLFLPGEFLIPGNGTVLLYAALSAFHFCPATATICR